MATGLIRMGDVVEEHGLVGYPYGAAEEHIIMRILSSFSETCYDTDLDMRGLRIISSDMGYSEPESM